jgi:SAM-dependent methyltransferase
VIRLAPVLEGQQVFGGKSEFYDLAALADARRLADWMYSQFAGSVRGDVCEIGPGIGTFSERILAAGARSLHLVEPSDEACDHLRGRFGSDDRVGVVSELLPGAASMQEPGQFDFVLAQNVLEHIEDDGGAAAEVAATLRPAGRFGVLVPAHPRLYSALDTAYGHHRRYTREHLRHILEGAGLRVLDLHSFNLLGVAGWWAKKATRSTHLDPRSLSVYEQLVRAWRPVEERLSPPWGLSLIAIAEKPA